MRPDESIGARENEQNAAQALSRRNFLGLSGAGLFLLFHVGPAEAFQEPQRLPGGRQGYPTDFNAYLHIGENGRVTCLVGKVELGQGSMTALAQLLAEELDVAFDTVEMVMGDTDLCPWDMGTFGSLCIRQFGPVLRAAGAEGRAVLLQMAGEQLQAPDGRLQVKDGVVTDPTTGKHVSYAELVKGKRIERHIEHVPVKPVSSFQVIGRSPQRKDALEKVTGKAKYAADMALPGTLHARILRPPAHGATLKSVDTSAAEKMAGVQVVKEDDLIAVLHERPDVAQAALDLVKAEFGRPAPGVDDKTVFDHMLKVSPEPQMVAEAGNLADGEKLATAVVEETYLNSYVAHAPIETHSAIAQIENGKATVWAGTQAPFSVKPQVARAIGLPQENVRIITPYVGGGFGGKSAAPQAVEAARLAKITGRPVQVVWDRAEEFFFDTFRPAAVVKIRSGLTRGRKARILGFRGVRRRRPRGQAILRRGEPAHGFGWRLVRRKPRRDAAARGGGVARALGQHQHVRSRVAHRYAGEQGGHRSGRVPPPQSERQAHAAGARRRREAIRLEAREGAQWARCRSGLRHLFGHVCREHGRGCRGQEHRSCASEAHRDRPGLGRRR